MEEKEERKVNKKSSATVQHSYDYTLLVLTILLVAFGLVMVYSTSAYNATKYHNSATFFLKKQAVFAIAGIAAMIFISFIDYHFYIKKILFVKNIFYLYALCIFLQIYVLVAGDEIKGSKRWIELPFKLGSFQPSEITKVCIILFTAYVAYLAPKVLNSFIGFLGRFVFVAPLLGLVALENLSTAIILTGIFVVICFVTSNKKLYFVFGGAALIGAAALFVIFSDYRGERFEAWLNVETHPKGFQTLQGLYAIASGGLWGKGLGKSVQKLGFIPESHNDMIFSVICEELGLVGALLLLFLFFLVMWRLFVIAVNAPDLFGSLVAVGILTHIALQVLINVAVVTNSIPSTGIPLPFISYGGSSLLVLLGEMGIALNISKSIEYKT